MAEDTEVLEKGRRMDAMGYERKTRNIRPILEYPSNDKKNGYSAISPVLVPADFGLDGTLLAVKAEVGEILFKRLTDPKEVNIAEQSLAAEPTPLVPKGNCIFFERVNPEDVREGKYPFVVKATELAK